MAYCTRASVYALGFGPEAFARPPRLIDGVVAASGTLLLRAHGQATDTALSLAVLSSSILGAPASALPPELAQGVTYYAQPGSSSDSMQLSATPGGAVISPFTDAGTGVFGLLIDHGAHLDRAIADATALVDAHLVAHRGPVAADVVEGVAARLAARIYVGAHGLGNAAYARAYEEVSSMRIMDERLMAGWLAGKPLPAGSTDATPTLAENGALLISLEGRGFLDACDEDRV